MSSHDQAPGVAKEEPRPRPLLLSEITILRFRSLDEVGPLSFQRGVTVLTGENDSGKTATLDAIGLLLNAYSLDPGDRSHWLEEGQEVLVEGLFVPFGGDPREAVRVRVRVGADGQHREVLDRVHRDLGARPTDINLNVLRTKMKTLDIPTPGGREKSPYVEATERWLAAQPEEHFEERWRPASQEELDRLPTFTRFTSVQAPSPTGHISSVVQREARRLLAAEPYAEQLSGIGRRLDQDIAPSLEHLRQKIREYCRDLDDIEIGAVFDFGRPGLQIDLRVRRHGQLFDLEKAGEGRRGRIALAIHEANLRSLEEEHPSLTEFIAYDEPDTHLDYTSQRKLFEILDRQARLEHVQLAVATHSLNFIDRVPLQSIVHFRLGDDLRTRLETLASTAHTDELEFLASVCAGLGLRNSVLLDERCFLVVEGETEKTALPSLFRIAYDESLTAAGITLFDTHGSRAIRRLVETLIRNWGRAVVLLADADSRDDIARWANDIGLEEGTTLHFIGAGDFEDSFSDEIWLRALSAHLPPQEGGPWTAAEITGLRAGTEAFGEALCNIVRRRCRDRTIGKPEIGLALARTVTAVEDIPASLRSCFEAVHRAASDRPAEPGTE